MSLTKLSENQEDQEKKSVLVCDSIITAVLYNIRQKSKNPTLQIKENA